jgi:hypothetical protein
MKRSLRDIALMAIVCAAAPAIGAEPAWEVIKQSDGIVVDRRAVEGSSLKEFRGRGVVYAPVAAILAVFSDVDRATEWMDSCNGSRVVADVSDVEKIVYNRTHAPWPVSDRDAVLRNVARFDEAERSVRLEFSSIERADAPPVKGVVRMPFLRGHWYLWPAADGNSTRVEYQVHANPGGRLPDWLVNYVSRDLPWRTINSLRAQVKRRAYPDFEQRLRERFPQYPFLYRCAPASERGVLGEKRAHVGRGARAVLLHRHVAEVVVDAQLRARDVGGEAARVGDGDQPISFAPDDQRRHV